VKPDYSFEREGKPLSDWLWRMVAEGGPIRQQASENLYAMWLGLPRYDMGIEGLDDDTDFVGQRARFEEAVVAALPEPEFDTKAFLCRLSALRVASHFEHLRRVDVEFSREQNLPGVTGRLREMERQIAQAANKEGNEEPLVHPATYCAAFLAENRAGSGTIVKGFGTIPAEVIVSQIAARIGQVWLKAPEALHFMLDTDGMRSEALKILAGIGTPAVSIVPRLLQDLDANHGNRSWFSNAEGSTLGEIGAGTEESVDALLARVNHPAREVRCTVAYAIEYMNGNLCGREHEAIEALFASARQWQEDYHLTAIASAGRHIPTVRAFLVEIALGNPAKWSSTTDSVECLVEPSMGYSGWAIDAMRYLTEYPDECVPILIAALDTFEEYDPDETYDGRHSRVVYALKKFGDKSVDAVLPVARELAKLTADDEAPKAILDYLGSLGPRAGAALPYVEAYRERTWYPEAPLPDLAAGPADEFEDSVGLVIQKIWGVQA